MHYYYLKLAFQQTFSAPDIGLTRNEFVLFISFGLIRTSKEENSWEFADYSGKLELFSASNCGRSSYLKISPLRAPPVLIEETKEQSLNPPHRPLSQQDTGIYR
jgi:hypothetical protein